MTSRPIQPMPDDVQAELEAAGLVDEYAARPFYQRNDYLAWISRAKRDETRQSRLTQMLDELAKGGVYMKMNHPPSHKT